MEVGLRNPYEYVLTLPYLREPLLWLLKIHMAPEA
jgi:hypothetical protein